MECNIALSHVWRATLHTGVAHRRRTCGFQKVRLESTHLRKSGTRHSWHERCGLAGTSQCEGLRIPNSRWGTGARLFSWEGGGGEGGGSEVEVVGPCHVEDSSTRISAPARWWSGGQSPDGGDILSAHQVVRDSRLGLKQDTCLQPFSPVHTMSAWTPLVWCPRCSTASVQDP